MAFAILWIVLYVALSGAADRLSLALGAAKSVTLAVHMAMCAALFLWMRKQGLLTRYGFCRGRRSAKRFLYYIPLAVIASASLWTGVAMPLPPRETAFFVLSMLCVGFLEEVIFRGLLFRAMAETDPRAAMIVSSLTFGLGHVVNLFNGSGQGLADTLLQIVFAVLVGAVLVLILHHGGSLIPCILFHGVNNALTAFGAESTLDPRLETALDMILIVVVCGGYLIYLAKTLPLGGAEEDHP